MSRRRAWRGRRADPRLGGGQQEHRCLVAQAFQRVHRGDGGVHAEAHHVLVVLLGGDGVYAAWPGHLAMAQQRLVIAALPAGCPGVLGAVEQAKQVGGHGDLSGMSLLLMDPRVEWKVGRLHGFHTEHDGGEQGFEHAKGIIVRGRRPRVSMKFGLVELTRP